MSSKYFYAFCFAICLYMVYLAVDFVQSLPKQCPVKNEVLTQPAHSLCVSLNNISGVSL